MEDGDGQHSKRGIEKKEEEKDKKYYKHVNDTYKKIEEYSEKYL